MSSVVIQGDTSGSVALSAPAIAGTVTVTLPATTGTMSINGPAFSAYKSATQSITTTTFTKVTFQTEEFDTNSNFASSTFTPTVAGYYQVQFAVAPDTTTSNTQAAIYKNGTVYKRVFSTASSTQSEVTCLVYLNGSTDYIEAYAFIIGTSPVIASATDLTYFQASMVRGA